MTSKEREREAELVRQESISFRRSNAQRQARQQKLAAEQERWNEWRKRLGLPVLEQG